MRVFRRTLPAILWAAAGVAQAAASQAPVVATRDGRVAGLAEGGVRRFLGVPFAAPPVGPLRWRPPVPPARWSGVRDARRFASACAQSDPLGAFAAPSDTEDCLYLNVFAPAARPPRSGFPVLVWIPGGAQVAGSAADYDASRLARDGRLIVVTFNYRVGLFGFFAHPAIDGEGHPFGNYGLMDQQAALRWVRDNIARFGGNPRAVTLGGQSAGGSSVLAALASPGAAGLFRRAIDQSGARLVLPGIAAARKRGEDFAAAAGCGGPDAARCLRALDVAHILARQGAFAIGVMVDGTVLPVQPAAALADGSSPHVPILAGFVADEQAFNLAAREMAHGPLAADGLSGELALYFGAANVARLLAAYPPERYGSPSLAEIAAARGARSCTLRWIAATASRHAPVFAYEFGDAAAPSYFPSLSFPMGAYHTAELQYVFPGFRGGLGTRHDLAPAQAELSRLMIAYWSNFVARGDPNGRGLPPWPRYDPARDAVRALGGETDMLDDYGARNDCGLWAGINPESAGPHDAR